MSGWVGSDTTRARFDKYSFDASWTLSHYVGQLFISKFPISQILKINKSYTDITHFYVCLFFHMAWVFIVKSYSPEASALKHYLRSIYNRTRNKVAIKTRKSAHP